MLYKLGSRAYQFLVAWTAHCFWCPAWDLEFAGALGLSRAICDSMVLAGAIDDGRLLGS